MYKDLHSHTHTRKLSVVQSEHPDWWILCVRETVIMWRPAWQLLTCTELTGSRPRVVFIDGGSKWMWEIFARFLSRTDPQILLGQRSDWTMTFDPVTQMFHQSRSGWVFNKEQMFPWRPCGDALSGTFLIIVLNLFWRCEQCTKIIEGKWILHKVTSTWSSA